jgi:2-oxoglutarate dehydrogenase E1 component
MLVKASREVFSIRLVVLTRKCNSNRAVDISLSFAKMLRAFRTRGHFASNIDPLQKIGATGAECRSWWLSAKHSPDVVRFLKKDGNVDLSVFGLQDIDMHQEHYLGSEVKVMNKSYWSLTDLVSSLRDSYCGNVGIEYTHIENSEEVSWLESKIEGDLGPKKWCTVESYEQLQNLDVLQRTTESASFLGKKFPSAKFFGIEGCECLLPCLWAILRQASELGVEGIEMGMAHRGRMNVLHNVFLKNLSSICNDFNESEHNYGDVKYHLGTRAEVSVDSKGRRRRMHMSLAANPSHLEAVNSIVIGKTKATQFYAGDTTKKRIMPLLVHGDASFCGQGIVSEVLELSNHPDYTVGGCIHVIINNQIGFTTNPREARYSYQCTNVAKGIEVPIFHVNGDDVDAVVSVCKLAVEWRQTFGKDCVVDIVCYRRQGINSV